jgi:uncharacterized protein (TIGR01244 family)
MSRKDLITTKRNRLLAILILTATGCGRSSVDVAPAPPAGPRIAEAQVAALAEAQLGTTPNLHRCGPIWLAGQPAPEDLAVAKAEGVQTVVNLRQDGEIDWDEAAAAQQVGLDYQPIPFRGAANLTDEIFDQVRQILAQSSQNPMLLHCGTANRVGAVWLPYRVLDQGVALEQAVEEARQIGLRDEAYEQRARDYIQQRLASDP